ncbi:MAG: type IX secretion system outer membrane channel protein PorV [Schleiferiaceae bacterium]|nr:type IX secretion system outer membrane channel protein PorV [Schleiferiaceae bacterium]
MKKLAFLSLALVFAFQSKAQSNLKYNVVTTAVPILLVSPDSRAGAMGDVGVASTPDGNSSAWNPAKLAFLENKKASMAMSYTPWMSKLVPDIDLAYVNYTKALSDRQGISASLRYFSLGEINFTNEQGNSMGTFNPYEFYLDVAYALKLSDHWSAGTALRWIYSDIAQGQVVQGLQTKPGQSGAADLGFYYQSDYNNIKGGRRQAWSAGIALTNLGAKIAYSESGNSDFLPTNLRIGGGYHLEIDQYNQMSVYLDLNRLVVPTPPELGTNGEIVAGMDDNVTPLMGVFQSFNPAAKPGGFDELLQENIYNFGLEYKYDNFLFARTGYLHEHKLKGNRQYVTMGFGLQYNVFTIDMAYLIPASPTTRSPLENTLRFSMAFNIDGFLAQ